MNYTKINETDVEVIMQIQDIVTDLVSQGKADWCGYSKNINVFNFVAENWRDWCDYDEEHIAEDLRDVVVNFWTNKILEELPSKRYVELKKKRAYFEDRWNNGGGFMKKLCDTITVADTSNLIKLHKAFPELVEGYIAYGKGKTWEEFIQAK